MDEVTVELTKKLQQLQNIAQRMRHLESLFDALGKFDRDMAELTCRVERLEVEASRGDL